jgi:uncharacterized protein (TIGR03435 family)
VKGTKIPIGTLVNLISQRTGRIVVDKTGLNGLYSFTLSWVPDETELAANGRPVTRNPGDPSGPSLIAALEEQLGLRLEAQKVPMSVVVIDSVQCHKPTRRAIDMPYSLRPAVKSDLDR